MTLRALLALLSTILLLGACSSRTESPEPTVAPPAPAAATPLIGAALTEPIPTPATDGRTHLAYEVQLTNALNGNVTLESLTVSAGDRTVLTLAGDNLKFWTRALGGQTPTTVLGPGQSGIVWLDVAVDGGAEVPTSLTHSVQLKVAKPLPGLIGAEVTQGVAPVQVSSRKPVSIAAPLDGPNWLNADGCCGTSAHRTAANPINGKIFISERYAIDFVQLTDQFRLFAGDPAKLESYPYFGAPIHAVGAGKVVSVVDDLPEQVPGKNPTGLPLDQYGGNHIVQDLGDGNFAFYAHLKPGSITVKPGDELSAGQTVAALGNSGNSSAPHLHFHVVDGPDPLAANGLPFVIDNFRLTQRVPSADSLDSVFTGHPAAVTPGFAARDVSEVSPLELDVMNYSVGQ